MKQKILMLACLLEISLSIAGTLQPSKQSDVLTTDRCNYSQSQAAEVLNQTWGVYGSIFSGGNHRAILQSAAGTTDLYRLLKGVLHADLNNNYSEARAAENNKPNPEYGTYDWVLDDVVPGTRAALHERMIDVDIHTSTKFDVAAWNGSGKNTQVGNAYLKWVDAAVKTSRAPWNIYTQFTDAQYGLWIDTLKPQYAKFLSAYKDSGKSLEWFVIASEAAFPTDIDTVLQQHHDVLRSRVASCTATNAEYAAWAIATTKFERETLTELQRANLPKYMVTWQVTSVSKQIAASVVKQSDLPIAVAALRNLSEQVDGINRLIPALFLWYLDGSPSDARVLLDLEPLQSTPFSALHIVNKFDAMDAAALEQYYLEVTDTPRFRLERPLAAKYFREGDYEKSLQYIELILSKSKISWEFDAQRMLESNLPIDVRTSALVLAIDAVSDWSSYRYICDSCYSRVKDAPDKWLGTAEATARRQWLFDLLLGTPETLAQSRNMAGWYQDDRFDRAKNSFRPELLEDAAWVSKLRKPNLSALLGPVTPVGFPRVTDRAVTNIMNWAANEPSLNIDNSLITRLKRKFLNQRDFDTYVEKDGLTEDLVANALESVVYASRGNSMMGTPHPAQEASRILERKLPKRKSLSYWHRHVEDRRYIYLLEQ